MMTLLTEGLRTTTTEYTLPLVCATDIRSQVDMFAPHKLNSLLAKV